MFQFPVCKRLFFRVVIVIPLFSHKKSLKNVFCTRCIIQVYGRYMEKIRDKNLCAVKVLYPRTFRFHKIILQLLIILFQSVMIAIRNH